ncbi:MAG: mannose-6-phosphate isomerase, class I [Actinobacteria bacterium]|uniref:mannose-6-phosphate isomerase n=1 Tax=freshwater metagenome TaxID=449393 RepID=A0A6J6I2P5_9ZZZZ|nr:mannose-6-phosphate isomerase, class I [Actinomycetota bacterium]
MLVRISGEVKNFPWGSKHLIQDQLGLGPTNREVAEVWFGTHAGGQSKLLSSGQNLSEAIGSKLSFLVKFLAADSPLSIQVHPNSLQAKEGFAKENAAGIDLTDPKRNYKDDSHKPEILIALSAFEALCGFRPRAQILEIFLAFSESEARFGELAALAATDASLEAIFSELLEDSALAGRFASSVAGLDIDSLSEQARLLVVDLLDKYPGETGALVSLLLNFIHLAPGEAIYLPAGNLHAYLSGLGLEVMAASNNVIRGGLTSKHIDKAELRNITDFSELAEPKVYLKKLAEGLVEYPVSASEFRVYRAQISGSNLLADIDLPAAAVIVCVSGEIAVGTSQEEREVLKKGEVVFVSEAKKFSLSGSGEAFVVLGS